MRKEVDPDDRLLVKLAIGRLFRMLSRPSKSGDVEEYETLRSIVLDHSSDSEDYEVNYARDRLKGSQGD